MKRDPIVRVDSRIPDSVLSLFSGLVPHQLHVDAVVRGIAGGAVYVDSLSQPTAACIFAGDACYLGGAPAGPFLDAVNELFSRNHYTAVFAASEISEEDIARTLDGLYMLPARRRVGFLRRPPGPSFPVPDGVVLRDIDSTFLESGVEEIGGVLEGIQSEWGTADAFLRNGFGAVALCGDRVVAHSVTDYVAAGTCEIGIRVAGAHRRRGIGTAVAGRVAGEAFARGFKTVAWHSWANNAGSIGVSRRIGFHDEAFYTVYINHWAAENPSDMTKGEFRAFAEEYERLLDARPPVESGYPHTVAATAWAAAGDRVGCLRHLNCAVDMGWLESQEQLRELWPELFADPSLPERVSEWGALFARLRSAPE